MEECFKSDMYDINGQYIGRWLIGYTPDLGYVILKQLDDKTGGNTNGSDT